MCGSVCYRDAATTAPAAYGVTSFEMHRVTYAKLKRVNDQQHS
jgi:hypothetical protein